MNSNSNSDHDKFRSTVEAAYITWDAERQVYDRMDVLQKELCRKIGEMIARKTIEEFEECVRILDDAAANHDHLYAEFRDEHHCLQALEMREIAARIRARFSRDER